MTATELYLVNIQTGNKATFAVEFLDINGDLVIPTGGSIEIQYTQNSVSKTDTVTLTQNQSFFVGTWGSSSVDHGTFPFSVYPVGFSNSLVNGYIRIIETT